MCQSHIVTEAPFHFAHPSHMDEVYKRIFVVLDPADSLTVQIQSWIIKPTSTWRSAFS